ncbi:MAG: diaminopimelate epimerase [Bacteroidales bacterium]|jgi:diaminopimelate epimerase|nr:diaminopimelate epimerase [Bacteroidales bacterium]
MITSENTFYKFHGAGNDFILFDNRAGLSFSETQIRHWCERHMGVGADGFILLENDLGGADFKMRYHNADGAEASLCGNGSRCAVAFAHYLGIIDKQCVFNAFDGLHRAKVLKFTDHRWVISLEMNSHVRIQRYKDGYFTNTGSPHFVRFVNDVNSIDIIKEGRKLRYDPQFPEGCNANFVIIEDNRLTVRTYERGVEDETLSCGTGVTAAALAFALQNDLSDGNHTILINTKGGFMQVSYTKQGEQFCSLYLEGPAVLVFKLGIFF